MTKPKLIILSDLWGNENSEWLQYYSVLLETQFKLSFYDCRALAQIPTKGMTEPEIHHQFLHGGIDLAVEKLLETERKPGFVLGFSIGGTIAWKAALNGLPVIKFFAISSTRLRKEYQKPKCEIELYFGANDLNRPMDEWFEQLEIYPSILRGKNHDFYKEEAFANQLCEELISSRSFSEKFN